VVGEDAFCCTGCEVAWSLVHEAGLDAYYARRDEAGTRPAPLTGAWESVPFTELADGSCEVTLQVDGLRCASCTWVVESLVGQQAGVHDATVSYATGRTRVRFEPDAVSVRALADTIAKLGYSPRPLDAPAPRDDLLARLGVAAFCTANLMLLSVSLYAGWGPGMEARFQTLFQWGSLALATPIAAYAAAPFFHSAYRGLRAGAVGMDVPIAIAVTVLYAHGAFRTLNGAEGYLDSLGMLVTLLLVGRVLERRGRRAAADAAAAIASSLPVQTRRRTETGVEDVPVDALVAGDVVELGLGDEVPVDGTVIHGQASIQMAILTGEAEPVSVGIGGEVVAGASVLAGAVAVRVDKVGEDTLAHRLAAAVRAATDRPLPPNPADRLAPAFTIVTLTLAGLAGAAWALMAGPERGIEVGVAVLVVACPCALGLSVPLAVASGLGAVARRGVVFQDGGRLLALAGVRTVVMDKTGTVTGGTPAVLSADDDVLARAASLERSSRHPIARAILAECERRGLALPLATDVSELPGSGIEGRLNGEWLRLTSAGPGAVVLQSESGVSGVIRLGDQPRDDAAAAIAQLHAAGIRTQLLSGDHPEVTAAVGQALGLDAALGSITPEGKAEHIDALRRDGPVAFIGDGLNDGAALAAADVGLAMHSGVTSSVLLADAVVTRAALRPLVAAVAGARATEAAVKSNLTRAIVYNIAAIAAAMFGLINPLVAAILMPLSSAWVVIGALSVDRRIDRMETEWTS